MKILGIETSCDETGAAIIEATTTDAPVTLLSNVLASSLALHVKTGGIIPEVAAREQLTCIIPTIDEAFEKAALKKEEIDAIAVTVGPGLIGSLLVGVETAKTFAYALSKPIIPVNHLFGHIYANWIAGNNAPAIVFPTIALVVSGGHTDLVLMKSHTETIWLGGTRDDAAGECFDKCARLLGYDYPGGPKISALGEKGNAQAFALPRPMQGSKDYDFSFSGLKTAFLNLTKQNFPLLRREIPNTKGGWEQIMQEDALSDSEKQTLFDLCASLEKAIIDTLVAKTLTAVKEYQVKSLIICGGVSANKQLSNVLKDACATLNIIFSAPPPLLCTDNAAMIAAAGFYHHKAIPWQEITADPELYFD